MHQRCRIAGPYFHPAPAEVAVARLNRLMLNMGGHNGLAAPFLQGPAGDSIRAQSPLNRAATAEEVARVVVFLASPGAEYLTGAIVDVNGASYLRT